MAICGIYLRNLGELFPSFLHHILLFQFYREFRHHHCFGSLYRRQYRSDSANPQRFRSMAFCREDHIGALWCVSSKRWDICVDSSYFANRIDTGFRLVLPDMFRFEESWEEVTIGALIFLEYPISRRSVMRFLYFIINWWRTDNYNVSINHYIYAYIIVNHEFSESVVHIWSDFRWEYVFQIFICIFWG